MKYLTKAEEQVMQYLWKLEKAFLKDIVEEFPDPKPAYTTISTVIRVLVKKRFIAYNSYSKVHEYYPLISKSEYFRNQIKGIIKNFYDGSISSFANFFTEGDDISITELEKIRQMVDMKLKNKRKSNG